MSAALAEPPPVGTPRKSALRSSPGFRVVAEGTVDVPSGVEDYETFRDWVLSDGYPHDGSTRFAWIDGKLEIDMTGGDIVLHESPKSQVGAVVVS